MPLGFKYSKQWEIELRKYYSHSEQTTKSFFVHPRLKIDKNISRYVNCMRFSTLTKAFNDILWNFKIKERFTFTLINASQHGRAYIVFIAPAIL